MKIRLKEDSYLTITPRQVQRALFLLLSVAMVAVVGERALSRGRVRVKRLDSQLQSVEFPHSSVDLYVGDSLEEQPVHKPSYTDVSYTWELENDGILTVENGKIIAVKSGVTTVGVTAGAFNPTLRVTVSYKPLPPDSTLPPLYYDKLPIANYRNTLEADFVPDDLIAIPAEYVAENYATLYVTQETFDAYKELLSAMRSELDGKCRMHIISAYRSYAKQSELYDKAVRKYMAMGKSSTDARVLALGSTQTPGHSEHQLGTTIDVSNDYNTDHSYRDTPEGKWLAENAHKYGFIIRYPEDKEDITRIAYEPWHIRYVGVLHATYMVVNNICLEEYETLQQQAEETAETYAETLR